MEVGELTGAEFVEFGDHVRFGGERALLVDALAVGLCRQAVLEQLGESFLTAMGFVHGWRTAEVMSHVSPWPTPGHWSAASVRGLAISGAFVSCRGQLDEVGLIVTGSAEAEQHRRLAGRARRPCCWVLAGTLQGIVRRCTGSAVMVVEAKCEAAGDDACRFVTRPAEATVDANVEAMAVRLRALPQPRPRRAAGVHASGLTSERRVPHAMVGSSVAMIKLLEAAQRVARVDATVLITGESGTGKERIAQLIHASSERARGPFVAVNCAAVSETLLESELFGHARGSFTGATSDRPGYFEAAAGGTLFLDEIGEVSPAMQVKLLRVLQERQVRRVGENRERSIDVRVIAATNKDLEASLRDGSFREDLYYRLKVVDLAVPPLRLRREDVLPLARLFLKTFGVKMKREVTGFSPQAADQLVRYRWPGNVRELENAVERAVAFSSHERVELDDLPEVVRVAAPEPVLVDAAVRPLATIEREYILAVLARNGGNQTKTAAELGIGTVTLYRKLKAYRATPTA
ncbi:MAG: sigma 54-interacting transcriptional regulator [Myxococcaceae bacterium]|jgi:DNA-binding NtrC family response regulator|nr:sigma 54-interacting transcriptional regulator [Myxococcaceae bacterium]